MKILVTGNAGFIGFHTVNRLLQRGDSVVWFSSVNDYYDTSIKEARLKILENVTRETEGEYIFIRNSLANFDVVSDCFKKHAFDRVILLAAQAGVRYSLEKPHSYVKSNIITFTHTLETCRYSETPYLTYVSTSSAYGANTKIPFSEYESANHPLQFYSAIKKVNELMAHSYSHLFKLLTTGLRFFTVYGPWGCSDMALFKFTKNTIEGQTIPVFNHCNHTSDFTYVEEIVEGVIRSSDQIAKSNSDLDSNNPDPETSNALFRVFNIGNNNPVKLSAYIEAIKEALGGKAIKDLLPLYLEMLQIPTLTLVSWKKQLVTNLRLRLKKVSRNLFSDIGSFTESNV